MDTSHTAMMDDERLVLPAHHDEPAKPASAESDTSAGTPYADFERDTSVGRAEARDKQEMDRDYRKDSVAVEAISPPVATKSTDAMPQLPTSPAPSEVEQMKISVIRSVLPHCTEDDAKVFLSAANGDVQTAMSNLARRTLLESSRTDVPAISTALAESQIGPTTLLEEALTEYAKKPQKLRKSGNVAVILSVRDLSKTFIFDYADLIRASPFFDCFDNTESGDIVGGVQYLFILEKSSPEDESPELIRRPVSSLRADLEGEAYTPTGILAESPTSVVDTREHAQQLRCVLPTRDVTGEKAAFFLPQLKTDDAGDQEQNVPAPVPAREWSHWLDAYESFMLILSHMDHGISPKNIHAALPRMEAVARIGYAYGAATSVGDSFSRLLTHFIDTHQLWRSIASDPARWLLVGLHLESALVFKESLKHLAGCYPHWPWKTSEARMPPDVLKTIQLKSQRLQAWRCCIEHQLLMLTLSVQTSQDGRNFFQAPVSQHVSPTSYATLNLFRDWIANHLSHIHFGDKGPHAFPFEAKKLCNHSNGCLTLGGLFRTLNAGGDAFLSCEYVLAYWNKADFPRLYLSEMQYALKELKRKASEIVKPLVKSTLQYEGRDELDYLTCVDVEEEDIPWRRAAAQDEEMEE